MAVVQACVPLVRERRSKPRAYGSPYEPFPKLHFALPEYEYLKTRHERDARTYIFP